MEERERDINVWLPLTCPPTEDLAGNPGMCPDWELNRQPFGLQDGAQSIEPHQPGPAVVVVVSAFLVCVTSKHRGEGAPLAMLSFAVYASN